MNTNMSWDLPTKTRWLAIMREHQTADRFIQGTWLSGVDDQGVFRGCFFGCAMQSEDDPLEEAVKDMHLPPWLVHLAENIFEGLSITKAELFPVQLLESIPVDTDLSGVECKQHISRLNRLLDLPKLSDDVISMINGVKNCWTQRLNGIPESDIPWHVVSARATLTPSEAAEAARAAEAATKAAITAATTAAITAATEAVTRAATEAVAAARSVTVWRVVADSWSIGTREVTAAMTTAAIAAAEAWQVERDVLIQLLSEVSGE